MESITIGNFRVTVPRGMAMISRLARSNDINKNISLEQDIILKPGDYLPIGEISVPAGDHNLNLTIDCDVPQINSTFVCLEISFYNGSTNLYTYNLVRSVVRVGSVTLFSDQPFSTTNTTIMKIRLAPQSDEIRIRTGGSLSYQPINIKIKSAIQKTD